ncbi:C14orf166 [Branchiostoma lanceolatum]|uniref:RNA transcription, translation and transport factor protein n=1 Tax=Branchiostoma lanceolatum TaxID=7740 RepID=A0A8J9ZVN8_BRALA|nr:C14orf166 [Branchiostoma lanceolatum]
MLMRLYPTFAEGHRRIPKPKPLEPSLVADRVEGPKSALMAHRALRVNSSSVRKARRSQSLPAVSGSVRCRLQPSGFRSNFLVFSLSFKNRNMFRRKLAALEYQQPNSFNIAEEAQFRNMIVWLEDQKVRHYKIEDRANLRNIQSADWPIAFKQYLEELACPVNHGDKSAVMDWLLGYAVRLEYGDNVEKYRQVKGASVQQSPVPAPSSDVLGSIDPNSADFRAGVASLAQLLQIPQHDDQLMLLKAIRKLILEKLSKEAIAESQNKKTEVCFSFSCN